jgi:hypothetical protein
MLWLQGLPVKTATGEVVFAPNKQQQRLLIARVQVQGVTVQDDLLLQQEQEKGRESAEAEGQDDEEQEEENGAAAAAAAAAGAREGKGKQQQAQKVTEPQSGKRVSICHYH